MELYFNVVAKQSPLKEQHQANGAHFVEEEGWILPLDFGDPAAEYRVVRSQVGILELCHRGILRFTGADRLSYLQGMVSNDVKQLPPGEGTHAAVLDVQGKILADVRIFCLEDSFLLDLWEPLKEKILTHLNRYLIADNVEISDLTGQYGIVSLQGAKAGLLSRKLLPNCEIPTRELAHRPIRIGAAEGWMARATHTGEEGYDLFVAAGEILAAVALIQKAGQEFSLRWIGAQAQEVLRVEAGMPRYGIDMNEENLLLETGLDRAVSFHKGCYLGQEVVERVRSRGHVNKKLAGLILEGDKAAARGSMIRLEEKELGMVTSSVLSPARKCPLALGYLHRDYIQPGTALAVFSGGKTIPAVVSALPFYRADSPLESPQEVG